MLDRTGYASHPTRRSPLGHRTPIASKDGGARLAERPFAGKIILRGERNAIGPALEDDPGIALPDTACTSAQSGDVAVLWLGPGEWMIMTPESDEKPLAKAIENALSGIHHQAVDVSDYYTVIRVSGEHCAELLARLTTLDLHPRAFTDGVVKGSIFGRVPAILHKPANAADAPCFDVIIRWSHADYLWCAIALAGRQYGVPEQLPEGRVKLAPAR